MGLCVKSHYPHLQFFGSRQALSEPLISSSVTIQVSLPAPQCEMWDQCLAQISPQKNGFLPAPSCPLPTLSTFSLLPIVPTFKDTSWIKKWTESYTSLQEYRPLLFNAEWFNFGYFTVIRVVLLKDVWFNFTYSTKVYPHNWYESLSWCNIRF